MTIGRDIGSMLGDPNDLALVLLFPASFALSVMLSKNNGAMQKLFAVAGFLVVFGAIIATQSRGGLLGIASVMGVFAWRRVKNRSMLIAAFVLTLTVLFALAGVSERASGGVRH